MQPFERPLNPGETTTKEHVREVLEQEIGQVQSPEAADAVVERLERLAAGKTEAERAEHVAAAPESAPERIDRKAAEAPTQKAETAAVLAETAAQAVAPTSEAPVVLEAAQEALGTRPAPAAAAPEVERGRSYLKQAILKRMGPLQAVDAQLYLMVNNLPHPPWADRAASGVTLMFTGGWIWVIASVLAYRAGVGRSRKALRELVPAMLGATWIVEYPIKTYFRRRRPFIDIVRALVVGKKPGSWSFPSGHTASSFASAWLLSRVWPGKAPLFFGIAASVGASRVYVGAHYPGDVLSGATLGMLFAATIRRIVRQMLGY